MGRGFFAGTMWGALVGLLAVALATQLTVRRELSFPEPQAAALDVPGGSEFDQARPETEPVVPTVEAPPAQAEPVEVAEPEPEDTAAPRADIAPADAPVASADAPSAAESPRQTEAPSVGVATADPERAGQEAPAAPPAAEPPSERPAIPALDAALPAPPDAVAQLVAPMSEGAANVAPSGPDPATATGEVASLGQSAEPMSAPSVETESAAAPPAPPPSDPLAPPAPALSDPPAAPAPDADPGTGNEIAAALPDTGSDARPAGTPAEAPSAPATETTAPAPPSGTSPPEPSALDDTGLPQVGFSGASGVKVNRLPTIGDGEDEPVSEEVAGDASAPEVDPDAPPLVRHAVPFENPDLAPVLAIVLLHDDPVAPGPATGLDLPAQVSFAVDAGLLEAGSIADAYRDAGREIVLVPTLPPGAAPSDVEVALEVNLATVTEAVAVMDRPDSGFQSERAAVAQVVDAISQTGHGLVTFPRGLNTAQQLAERAGVPSRLVFRVFETGNADAVLRTLDQAAFRARQEGVVILVGEAEPATVGAIRSWIEGNGDEQVVFAPISAALTAE